MQRNSLLNFSDILHQTTPDIQYIRQIFEYYGQCYQRSHFARAFVRESVLVPDSLKSAAIIGYCDRTIGRHIPRKRTPEGGAIRGALFRCGLLRPSGHELFRGCVVFPELDGRGAFVRATGYRVSSRVNRWHSPTVEWTLPNPDDFIQAGMFAIRSMLNEKARV